MKIRGDWQKKDSLVDCVETYSHSQCYKVVSLWTLFFKPPLPVGIGGGYMFSGRPSVRVSVHP